MDDNPWAGHSFCQVPLGDAPPDFEPYIWRFAPDGRSVELDTGVARAVLKLRATRQGWLAQSRPLSWLFRRDGQSARARIGTVREDELRFRKMPDACS